MGISVAAASALLTVLIGPNCPGPEVEGKPCPSVPWVDVAVRLSPLGVQADRRAVLHLRSGAEGHVRGEAAPGLWRVEVLAPKPARCPTLDIELPHKPGTPLPVIDCDSGRR